MLASFLSLEFLLYIQCWLNFCVCSFSYTSRAGFIFMRGVSLTHPVLPSFLCREFLLHTPCWLLYLSFNFFNFYLGSFSYTSRAGFIFIRGVPLTHPVLASFLSGEFLLHIPCCLHFYSGSFSYTSRAGFFFFLFFSGEFLLLIPCWLPFFFFFFFFFFSFLYLGCFSYTSRAAFIFIWGVSLTHPMLASFFCGEFFLQIPCWLYFSVEFFSYTSHAGFFF